MTTTPLMRLRAACTAERRSDSGAAAVEFAILLPLFLMLVFGLITGGLAFERWINVTQAAREASRFAATYPVTTPASMTAWFNDVKAVAAENAGIRLSGANATPAADYSICVAFVNRVGPGATPATQRSTSGSLSVPSGSTCTGSTIPDNAVEVVIRRKATVEWLLGGGPIAVTGDNTSRYEPRIAP